MFQFFRILLAPRSSLLALCVLACFWLLLIYNLGAQWSIYEQYNYGWAVPFLCAYLLYRRLQSPVVAGVSRRHPSAAALAGSAPTHAGGYGAVPSPGAEDRGEGEPTPHFSISAFQLSAFFFCLLAYALTRWLHEANPIWRLTSWLWALEVIAITLFVIRYALGAKRLAQVAFAIGFFLVAVPWPSGLEGFLTQMFQRWDVGITSELLGLFGIPAVPHGTTFEIRSGMVGVDEACSGIRSFQATLMLSLFFGELYSLTVLRRAFFVLAGFALAFVFNVGRTFLLVAVASSKGISAVNSWHDPAGTAILVLCFLSLWLLATRLQKNASVRSPSPGGEDRGEGELSKKSEIRNQKSETQNTKSSQPVAADVSRRHLSTTLPSSLSYLLLAWLLAVELGTEFWYRAHEHRLIETPAYPSTETPNYRTAELPINRGTAASPPPWSIRTDAPRPNFITVPIPAGISVQFRADLTLDAHWHDDSGHPWQLYYFRWQPAYSVKKRVAIQLAKTHGPEICLEATGMALKWVHPIELKVGDMPLTILQHLFLADGKPIYVFYGIYEDPTGTQTLANRRLDTRARLAAALAGSRNFGQRFLELAVWGYDNPELARAAAQHELTKLISFEKENTTR